LSLPEGCARRSQQTPATAPQTPVTGPQTPVTGPQPAVTGPQTPIDGVPSIAPVERRAVPREGTAAVVEAPRVEGPAVLSPALAAAKAEIHSDLLRRNAAAMGITNRACLRRLLRQSTDDPCRF